MIYSRTGLLRYKKTLLEIIEDNNNMPTTQHDRKAGDGLFKFQNCDFTNQDFRGVESMG